MSATISSPVVRPVTYPVQMFLVGREAEIQVSEAGRVLVSCPHHHELNGVHYWTARGAQTIWRFIAELDDCDYVRGKLFNTDRLQEFDRDTSVRDLRRYLIRACRDGDMTRDRLHDLWWELDNAVETQEEFAALDIGRYADAWEFIRGRPTELVEYFDERIWKPFYTHIRGEVDAGRLP